MSDSASIAVEPATAPEDGIEAVLKVLREGQRFLVCSHLRPDGDAVGSVLAMGMLLEQMGKRADLVTADRIPPVYRSLPWADRLRTAMSVSGPYDAAILLECGSLARAQLSGLDKFPIVNIDHHASGRAWGQVNWIDRGAASVGQLVHRLVVAAGAAVTPEMATCLYTTLLTDTGGFLFGMLQSSTFALAHELVEKGADAGRIAQDVYFSTPLAKLLLLGTALTNLRREGRLGWLSITHEDMERTGAEEEDCEGIVNYALSAAGVEVAVFLCELPEGRIRLSLRSKGRVNVAAIAEAMGGGGHENAAGCTLDGPLDRARKQILAELRRHVDRLGDGSDPESGPASDPASGPALGPGRV
ncbi:MAG TPA: bifunctional oligoribonuclease/PAP phosphatase NrnA [Terracidiphilus sp.]|nr:bifunctional oligoribonuclease/PAP phosphatase NrnA [Terracidiphilus sp.]